MIIINSEEKFSGMFAGWSIEDLVCDFAKDDFEYDCLMNVIVSLDRTEYVLTDRDSGEILGGFILARQEDMHYGEVVVVVAHYIRHKTAGAHRAFVDMVSEYGFEYDCKYYQRSRHIAPNKQLIITKEVP